MGRNRKTSANETFTAEGDKVTFVATAPDKTILYAGEDHGLAVKFCKHFPPPAGKLNVIYGWADRFQVSEEFYPSSVSGIASQAEKKAVPASTEKEASAAEGPPEK